MQSAGEEKLIDIKGSNCWPSGNVPKAKRGTLCDGVTRWAHIIQAALVVRLPKIQIEYLVVAFDGEHRKVKLSLRQADILEALAEDEALSKQGGCVPDLQTVKQ